MSDDPESLPFSARNRGSQSQIDADFPGDARIGLLHLLCTLVEKDYVAGWLPVVHELQRIGRLPPTAEGDYGIAESVLQRLSWDKVYDFCERLHSQLAQSVFAEGEYPWAGRLLVDRSKVRAYITTELQRLFVEENLAFEFVDGAVRRRGRRHTVEQIDKAQVVLSDPRLSSARKHFDKALKFFRDPSSPDFENAVKEAVCGVEAAGKALFPDANAATLGDLVKWLMGPPEDLVPSALGKTFTGIYGYRNGGEGVSHGGSSGGAATPEVAEYVIAVASSQVIFLVGIANAREDDIPF